MSNLLPLALLSGFVSAAPVTDADRAEPLPAHARARIGSAAFRHPHGAAVAWSTDGKLVASGGDDCVSLWETSTGRELRRLDGGKNGPGCVALSRDGRLVAAGCASGEVLVWETATGRLVREFKGHTAAVATLAFAPDGKRLVSTASDGGLQTPGQLGGWGALGPGWGVQPGFNPWGQLQAQPLLQFVAGTCRVWDLRRGGDLARHVVFNTPAIYNAWFTPDCSSLIVVGGSFNHSFIECRDPSGRTSERVIILEGHRLFTGVPFPNRKAVLLVPSDGQPLRCLDLETEEELFQFPFPAGTAYSPRLVVSPDGSRIALSAQEAVVLLDGASGVEVASWRTDLPVASQAWSPDSRTLAETTPAGIRFRDAGTGRLSEAGQAQPVEQVWFSPDGREVRLLAGKQVIRHDPAGGREVARLTLPETSRTVALAHNGDLAVYVEKSGEVQLLDGQTGRKRAAFTFWAEHPSPSLALSADANRLAACTEKWLSCWQIATAVESEPLTWEDGHQIRVRYGPASGRLLVFRGTTLYRHDPASLAILRSIPLGASIGSVLAFSPDERLLCSLDHETEQTFAFSGVGGPECSDLLLLETATGQRRLRLEGHERHVTAAAFSPDGRLLASGDWAGVIRLWDTLAGAEVAVLTGHRGPVRSLAFAPDGKVLASAGEDTTVLLWDIPARPHRPVPAALEPDRLWDDLASPDAPRAARAFAALVEDPERSLPLLRARLGRRTAVDMPRLLAALDHDDFETRDRALEALAALVPMVRGALLQALAAKPSPEQARLLKALLERPADSPLPAEALRWLRTIEILERIGTPAALGVLDETARAGRGDWLAAEATAARDRLAQPRPR
jgi:WD40 repeat protein